MNTYLMTLADKSWKTFAAKDDKEAIEKAKKAKAVKLVNMHDGKPVDLEVKS